MSTTGHILDNMPVETWSIHKQPFTCPVCFGMGVVPPGFYDVMGSVLGYVSSTSAAPELCRSCGGTGLVREP
jgi:hypothetical protein